MKEKGIFKRVCSLPICEHSDVNIIDWQSIQALIEIEEEEK